MTLKLYYDAQGKIIEAVTEKYSTVDNRPFILTQRDDIKISDWSVDLTTLELIYQPQNLITRNR